MSNRKVAFSILLVLVFQMYYRETKGQMARPYASEGSDKSLSMAKASFSYARDGRAYPIDPGLT